MVIAKREKEDQQKLVEVMTEPEVKNMTGGHLSCVMKAEEYLEEIKNFLPGCFLNR